MLSDKSRTKRPRNTKIGRKVAHPKGNNAYQSQGQRPKVKVTRSTNADTGSASYLPNGKAYTNFKLGTQTQYEDPRSEVKVARSRDASGRCWPISRERNVETPKFVGRLPPGAIMRTSFKVKGQISRSPGRLMLRSEMRHIFRTRRSTNLKLGTQMEYED